MKIPVSPLVALFFATGALTAENEPAAAPPPELSTYYFVMLSRGPKWTPERTPEVEKIQAGHLANIGRLHDAGQLVLAGPFTDNGKWSGLFIFKTKSVEETMKLVETDPAVQSGRFSYEIHPWATKPGVLP